MNQQEQINSLKTLHFSMTFGVILISAFLYYLNKDQGQFFAFTGDLTDWVMVSLPLLVMGGINLLRPKRLEEIRSESDESVKWEKYRSWEVTKYALIEGPALIGILLFYIQSNRLYLIIGLCFILLLYLAKPSMSKYQAEAF